MLRDEKLLAVLLALGVVLGAGRTLTTANGPAAIRTDSAHLHLVDLDRADAPEMTALPGIGDVLAGRIVADRESRGPFGRIETLARVHGIGPVMVERLRSRTRFRPTLDGPEETR